MCFKSPCTSISASSAVLAVQELLRQTCKSHVSKACLKISFNSKLLPDLKDNDESLITGLVASPKVQSSPSWRRLERPVCEKTIMDEDRCRSLLGCNNDNRHGGRREEEIRRSMMEAGIPLRHGHQFDV